METFPVARNPQHRQALRAHFYLGSDLTYIYDTEYIPCNNGIARLPLVVPVCDVPEQEKFVPILPGECIPCRAGTTDFAMFLQEQCSSRSSDEGPNISVFVSDNSAGGIGVGEMPYVPFSGKGTFCSILCSNKSFSKIILYGRQRGTYKLDLRDQRWVQAQPLPSIEERIPKEAFCNLTSVRREVYPNKYNQEHMKKELLHRIESRLSVYDSVHSADLLEISAMVGSLLTDEDRGHLAEVSSVLDHLLLLDGILKAYVVLTCSSCRSVRICSSSDLVVNGSFHHYLNPHNFLHRILFARRAGQDINVDGEPCEENSWFLHYAWQSLYCAFCSQHVGWKFTRMRQESSNDVSTHSDEPGFLQTQIDSFFAFRTSAVSRT